MLKSHGFAYSGKRRRTTQVFSCLRRLTLDNYFEGVTNEIDVPDDISVVATEATTSASLFTRYTAQSAGSRGTRTSSKNRRREERKRARGKKGTVYEEEYLVSSISRLIQRVQDIREDVTRLIVALMMIDKRFEAGEMQNNFQRLVEEIKISTSEVFADRPTSNWVSRDEIVETPLMRDMPIVEMFSGSELLV
jgi:elongator complex protein 1